MTIFEGRKIRDEIIAELKHRVSTMKLKPVLAVLLIGDDPVSVSYVGLKQRIAEEIGVEFRLFHYAAATSEAEVLAKIEELNHEEDINGIMVQIPIPEQIDRFKVIGAISPHKDVDGLRFCQGLESDFLPPVVSAIVKALELSRVDLSRSQVAIIGHGFLVGEPLERYLAPRTRKLVVADTSTPDISSVTKYADVIISATGQAGLIRPEMVKDGAVLIDAGTSEVGGKLAGDVDPSSYGKASYYTPVPGGIGPVTVAMLMQSLLN